MTNGNFLARIPAAVAGRGLSPRGQQVRVVVAMYLGYAMFMVLRMSPTVAGAAMREDPALDIDLAKWGRIIAMSTWGAVLGKVIGGLAADRIGGKVTFSVGLLVSACCVGAFAASSEVWLFQVTFFGALMAKAVGWPSMAKLIVNWFPEREYGRVWGVLSTSSRVGTLLATFCLGGLLAMISWRAMLVVAAGAGLLGFLCVAWLVRERPVGWVPDAETPGQLSATAKPHPHPLDNTSLPEALVRLFSGRQFWLITASVTGLTILWDFLLFVPMFLQDTLQLTPARASMAASAFPLGSLISVLLGGYLFDTLGRRQTAWLMAVLLGVATGCIATFLLMPRLGLDSASAAYLSLALLFVFGLCVSPCYYIPMSVYAIQAGGPHSGFLIALIDGLGFSITAVFYYYAGTIAKSGWDVFLGVLLAVAAWSLLTTFFFLLGEARGQAAS